MELMEVTQKNDELVVANRRMADREVQRSEP
jgi:hypothetical protein